VLSHAATSTHTCRVAKQVCSILFGRPEFPARWAMSRGGGTATPSQAHQHIVHQAFKRITSNVCSPAHRPPAQAAQTPRGRGRGRVPVRGEWVGEGCLFWDDIQRGEQIAERSQQHTAHPQPQHPTHHAGPMPGAEVEGKRSSAGGRGAPRGEGFTEGSCCEVG
jgi:hypothetical protein